MVIRTIGRPPLADRLDLPLAPGPPCLPSPAYDAARRQFRALDAVEALASEPSAGPTVFLTGADLYLPGSPFVFGVSLPARSTALVSTFRLEGEVARLASVIRHEVAHLLGLAHCAAPGCLLYPASAPADIDARGADPCAACLGALTRGAR